MILAIDVGNTQTVLGAFNGDRLTYCWRIATDPSRTSDEYRHLLRGFLIDAGIALTELKHVLVSSVVPPVTRALKGLGQDIELFVVDHRSVFSFVNKTRHPETVGADRLVNNEAAVRLHGAPLIIVDSGTATTFDVINARREYLGGAITPGISISSDALFRRASRLANVDLRLPERAIGDTTETALQSGILLGHAALIDGMVERLRAELGEPAVKVVGSGGWMEVLAPACRTLDRFEPDLTLLGLKFVWENTVSSHASPDST